MTKAHLGDYIDTIRQRRVRRTYENAASMAWACQFGDDRFLNLMERGAFDILCHHAADVTNYKSYDFDYHTAVANNTNNLRQVLETFRDAGGQAVVLTGSVFEGGEGAGSDGLPNFSPYGLSKALTSDVFRYECRRAGVRLGKFVISNPFGPLEEPRFTTYLVGTWLAGQTPCVRTPAYVRDNIHVSALAKAYVEFVEFMADSAAPMFARVSPSGYIESQEQFARRFAAEIGPRLGIECPLEFAEQTEFPEPRVRIGLDPVTMSAPEERAAWDALAANYHERLMAPQKSGAAE